MKSWHHQITVKRIQLHIFFWAAWVFGFTFIKSFGMPLSNYVGWLTYYIVTLPVFVFHTYLIVYWLIPDFIQKKRFFGFTILFLVLFYLFSVLELIISNEFVFKYFSTGTEAVVKYLNPVNVIISGLGNLYIVLVFLAVRTIRTWYINQEKQKRIIRQKLALQVDNAISRVQPRLLIYAVNYIEKLAEKTPEKATNAIALTSEILNEVMIYSGQRYQVIEQEVALIRKLADLVEIFRGSRPDVEFFLSGDPSKIQFPSMILFSLVEMVFRQFDHTKIPEINIEISGFSNIATIQVLFDELTKRGDDLDDCGDILKYFEKIYPDYISVSFEHTKYGCSISIKTMEESRTREQRAVSEGR